LFQLYPTNQQVLLALALLELLEDLQVLVDPHLHLFHYFQQVLGIPVALDLLPGLDPLAVLDPPEVLDLPAVLDLLVVLDLPEAPLDLHFHLFQEFL
jgi:hypothetical protein